MTQTTSLTAGVRLVSEYLGDRNFIGSASPAVSQLVGQASTTTSLAASPVTSVFGHW